jgi:hypothetical protein
MKVSKRQSAIFCLTAVIAAALVFSFFSLYCATESDFCSEGNPYNAGTQFCYDGRAYNFCEGKEYDPETHGCEYGLLKRRCGTRLYDEAVQFCHADGNPYYKCSDPNFDYDYYDPQVGCAAPSARCGGFVYNVETQFCYNDRAYAKCGGQVYNPDLQECMYDQVWDK